ncbi:MAG: TRAP transporter small permease [Negativicutes bacterium]|nr:TRAP transporter small permease [Negativicutes bacterium]
MNVLSRFNNCLDTVVTWVCTVLFAIMVFATGAQIVARYVVGASLEWSEELARYMFIWSVLLGSSMCVKRRGHVGVELVVMKLPARLQGYAMIFADCLSAVFFVILIVYGIEVTEITADQHSPAMEFPMGLAYVSIPVSGLLMLSYTIENVLSDCRKLRKAAGITGISAAQGGK